ncbi:hypothetical protein EW146_g10184 [Bondarzewia mesenterica]|uniref:Uncharacterized protein n=1 Tax=Bondarzewia mesenterica TaxID=1095465 RepID=A0A4S4KZT1_9AGAM|nr:hypothetical protein EW146_g10184 [Bondarzewia mesenterica]
MRASAVSMRYYCSGQPPPNHPVGMGTTSHIRELQKSIPQVRTHLASAKSRGESLRPRRNVRNQPPLSSEQLTIVHAFQAAQAEVRTSPLNDFGVRKTVLRRVARKAWQCECECDPRRGTSTGPGRIHTHIGWSDWGTRIDRR